MSDTQQASRPWQFYVEDMIDFCERVLSYTVGMDQSSFVNNELVYDATLRNIELIGEAATRIPQHIRTGAFGDTLAGYHRGTQPHHSFLYRHRQ